MKKIDSEECLTFFSKELREEGTIHGAKLGKQQISIQLNDQDQINHVEVLGDFDDESWSFFFSSFYRNKILHDLGSLTNHSLYKHLLSLPKDDFSNIHQDFMQKFIDSYETETASFFNIYILMIQAIDLQYLSGSEIEKQYFDKSNQEYICRCFGVKYNELKSFITENPLLTLAEITDQLGVAIGCASCLVDVKKELRIANIQESHYRHQTPLEMVLKVEEELSFWNQENKESGEIVSFEDKNLEIRVNSQKYGELKLSLEKKFKDLSFSFIY